MHNPFGISMEADRVLVDSKQPLKIVISALNWLWSVFASVLVIAAFILVMYFTGARETGLWLNAMTWEQTQCEIDQVYSGRQESTETGSTSTSVSFKVSAAYRYQNDFGAYVGNRYDFRGMFRSSYQSVKKDLDYLRNNSSVPCYYNPRKPEQSVINRGFQTDFLIALIPLFTLGLFAWMALHSLLGKFGISKLFRPKKRSFLP